MPATRGLMMFFLQSTDPMSDHDMHLITIFVGIIAAALVAQAVAFIVASMFAAKLLRKAERIAESVGRKTTPILAKSSALMDDLLPKIRSVSENVEQISYTVRAKCDEVGETITQINRTVADVNDMTRTQAARVDGIVTDALHTTAEVSKTVQDGIRMPVRQIAGIIAGFRAGLETLAKRSPFGKSGKDVPNPYDL